MERERGWGLFRIHLLAVALLLIDVLFRSVLHVVKLLALFWREPAVGLHALLDAGIAGGVIRVLGLAVGYFRCNEERQPCEEMRV